MVKDSPNTPTPAITTGRKTIAQLCDAWPSRLRGRKPDGSATTKSDLKKLEARISNIQITDDRAAKGSSGNPAETKQLASISIGKVIFKEGEIEKFEKSIEFAKDVLESEQLGDLEDLEEARDSLDKLSQKGTALSEYKSKHPFLERYQIVSFSKLTGKHLTDMGVTSMCFPEHGVDRILQNFDRPIPNSGFRIQNTINLSAVFERFWQELTKDGRYINDFMILKKCIGRKPEARARMLTDYILTQLMVFVAKQLGLVQFMFLELVLSSCSDPVPIEYKNAATLLTGSVDYAILSSVNARADVAESLGVEPEGVEDAIKEMTSGSSLDEIIGSSMWPILQEFKHFRFTIIEEKRKDLGKRKLRDCEPQVIGESLALQSKTEQDHVLWCLSNGEEWIFGVVNDIKQSRSLPHMSINDNDLEGSIKAILKMLVLWTVCPVHRLLKLLNT